MVFAATELKNGLFRTGWGLLIPVIDFLETSFVMGWGRVSLTFRSAFGLVVSPRLFIQDLFSFLGLQPFMVVGFFE